MTKEQEARIKLLKDFTKMDFSNPMGWTGYYDTELKELSESIGTVLSMLKEKDKRINDLEYALLDMIMQFADRPNIKGSSYALDTMGLSALELAFDELGFDNPYPVKKADEKYQILAKQYFERKSKE